MNYTRKSVKNRVKNYRPVMELIMEYFCFSHVKRLAALSLWRKYPVYNMKVGYEGRFLSWHEGVFINNKTVLYVYVCIQYVPVVNMYLPESISWNIQWDSANGRLECVYLPGPSNGKCTKFDKLVFPLFHNEMEVFCIWTMKLKYVWRKNTP
jgi:hypothetical protein